MSDIYVQTMRLDFGCRARPRSTERFDVKELYQPEGRAFPTLKTFVYHVLKHFGQEEVRRTLIGRSRYRSKEAPIQGSFGERVWNLMQKGEADAYAGRELPRGYVEGSPLRPLFVVVKRDLASGLKTGIGFSLGAERAGAYRAATFCEAIGKVKYCALFGFTITQQQWPSIGVCAHEIRDRGPGATSSGRGRGQHTQPAIYEMPPAHSGQSKANVESSHSRTLSNDEPAGFQQSRLRTVELAVRSIAELIEFNDTRDVSEKIPPDLASLVSRPTPLAIWNALDSLGRNDAIQMSFEDAVRAYLDKYPADLTREGVRIAGRLYNATALAEAGALSQVSGSQRIEVEVYVLEACIRHVWLDWKGRLIELDVRHATRVRDEVKYMSMSEAVQYETFCKERSAEHGDHVHAARAELRQQYEEQTGHRWESAQRIQGRPKRGTAIAVQEAQEAKTASAMRGVK